jgi:DNA-binding IclR family transcriptional regulator
MRGTGLLAYDLSSCRSSARVWVQLLSIYGELMSPKGNTISTTTRQTRTARTLEKGLMILSLFDAEHPSWTLTSIAEATGMPLPTALRLARTLEKARYLRQNSQTRSYELGSAIYRAVSVTRSHSELIRVTRPHLEGLTKLTTETSALGVWEHGESLIIDIILTPRPFKPVIPVGTRIPGLATLHGQVAVAFAPQSVLEAALALDHPRYTEHTLTTAEELKAQIECIRRERVAFGIETIAVGMSSVAAPIFGPDGNVAASIAVVAPTERFGPIEMREYGSAVSRAAELVSRELGAGDGGRSLS